MQVGEDLREVNVSLYRNGKKEEVPIFFGHRSTGALSQLAYYELLGLEVKSDEVIRFVAGESATSHASVFDKNEDSTAMRTRLSGFMVDKPAILDSILDYNMEAEESIHEQFMKPSALEKPQKSKGTLEKEKTKGMIEEFVEHFMKKGIFDCNSKSLRSTATLHLFCVLLDIISNASEICSSLIKIAEEKLPDDFRDFGNDAAKQIQGGLILSLILDRNKGSPRVLKSLLLTQNRQFLENNPRFYLLAADLMDATLFGFDGEDYFKKRAILYWRGMSHESTRQVCKARLLGMFSLVDHSQAANLRAFLDQNKMLANLTELIPEAELPSWSGLNLVSFLDGFYCICLRNGESLSEQNYWRELAKYHIEISQKQTKVADQLMHLSRAASKKLSITGCKVLRVSTEQNLAEKYGRDDIKSIYKEIKSQLTTRQTLESLMHANISVIQFLERMTQEKKSFEEYLEQTKIVKVLKTLQTLLHFELASEHPTCSSLGYLGRFLFQEGKTEEGWNMLYYSLALKSESVADIELNNKTLLFIADRKKLYLSKACEEGQEFVNNIALENYNESSLLNLVREYCRRVYYSPEPIICSPESQGYFIGLMTDKLIAPGLVSMLDRLVAAYSKDEDSPENNDFSGEFDDVVQTIFKQGSEYDPKFLKQFDQTKAESKMQSDSFREKARVQVLKERVAKMEEIIASDPKITLFKKDMFDVYQVIRDLDTFTENNVQVYRGYFVANNQKCTIFKVPFEKSTNLIVLKKMLVYLKMFHPKILCFYGIIIDVNFKTDEIHLCYVAENFGTTLSTLDEKGLRSMSSLKKVQIIYDLSYAVYSFHSVGLSFNQLNPDLVTITNKTTKVIFPFFLHSRIHFSVQYRGQVLAQNKVSKNIVFLNPTMLDSHLPPTPVKLHLTDPDFFKDFGHLMRDDMYSLCMLCSYLYSEEFGNYCSQVEDMSLREYLNHYKTIAKQAGDALFEPVSFLGEKIGDALKNIYCQEPTALNTFQYYECLVTESRYEYPLMTLAMIKNNFKDTLSLINGENLGKGVIYPCSILLVPYDNVCENEAYFKNNLIMVGPYFNMEDGDSYKFDLFATDCESIKFEIEGGFIKSAQVFDKDIHMDTIEPKQSVKVASFRHGSWMPSDEVFQEVLIEAYSIKEGEGTTTVAENVTSKLSTILTMIERSDDVLDEQPMVDPFGNFLRVKRNEYLEPVFNQLFSIEAFSFHNLGKAMLFEKRGEKMRALLAKVSSYSYGDLSRDAARYVDFITHFDSSSMANAAMVSLSGGYFEGQIVDGDPHAGFFLEDSGEVHPVTKELIHEGRVSLNSDRHKYEGVMRDFCPQGLGKLIDTSGYVYRGLFSGGLPNGKGELFSKDNQETVFQGYFTQGRPYYGLFKGDQCNIEGRMFSTVNTEKKIALRESRNTFIEALSNEQLSLYIHGYKQVDVEMSKFGLQILCQVSPNLLLQFHSNESKFLAEEVEYKGVLKSDLPEGKGAALIEKNMVLFGIWNSADNTVTGWCISRYSNDEDTFETLSGVFTYEHGLTSNDKKSTLKVSGFAFERHVDGSMTAGFFADNGFLRSDAWLVKTEAGLLRGGRYVDSGEGFQGYVSARLPGRDNRGAEEWIEEWKKGVLLRVFNLGVGLEFRNWRYSCKDCYLEASVEHNFGKEYTIIKGSPIRKVSPMMIKKSDSLVIGELHEGEIFGYLFRPLPDIGKAYEYIRAYINASSKVDNLSGCLGPSSIIHQLSELSCTAFRGEMRGFEASVGVLRDMEGNLHIGEFRNNQLQGVGLIWYKNFKVLIMGVDFEEGVKEGVFLVSDDLDKFEDLVKDGEPLRKKIFLGEYVTNTKHGFGICYYYDDGKEVRQHILFKHGEVQTVFSEQTDMGK